MDARSEPSPTWLFGKVAERRLTIRIAVEVSLVLAAGLGALAITFSFFQGPDLVDTNFIRPLALVLIICGYLLGTVILRRAADPVLTWIRDGSPDQSAPDAARRCLVRQPSTHAKVLFTIWMGSGLILAAAIGAQAEDPRRGFIATLLAMAGVDIAVASVAFLAVERALRPWYPVVFADDDPSRFADSSSRLRSRLLASFVVATVVPFLGVGGLVSERIDAPAARGSLEALVWVLAGASIVVGTILVAANQDAVVRPLERLRQAADKIRGGDLDVSIPVESSDEVGAVTVAFNSMVAGLRERRQLEDLFGRHVGTSVAERALEAGVERGVQRQTVTVVFIDLVGFTAFSESAEPEEVASMLNEVFDIVVDETNRCGGLVNKFVGDAAMMVFGAPIPTDDHAENALDTADAIYRRLSTADRLVGFGIGIATGEVVAGNIGAEARFEYTVIGDTVNQAARLESMTREHNVPVLVAGSTVEAVTDERLRSRLLPLGDLVLRGKTSATTVYALTVDANPP